MSGAGIRWQAIRRRIADLGSALRHSAGGRSALSTAYERLRMLARSYRRRRDLLQQLERNDEQYRRDAVRKSRRARRRSLALLLRLLNPTQRQEFRKTGHFHVIGASTGECYRIRTDMIANIDVMQDNGTVKYRLCVRPAGDVPVYDVMAAQLLHLQDAAVERRFLQHANVLTTLPEDRVYFRSIWLA